MQRAGDSSMPFLSLQFPAFDPVLISIGPFQIRWYALAYIVGILLGWLYARALIRNERLWGGPAPLTRRRLRRFRAVGDARHHPRRPASATCCSTIPAHFLAHPLEALQLWKGGMSFHGGFVGCVLAVVLFARRRGISILSLGDLTCAAGDDRAVSRPHRQFHQRRALGSPDRRALGYGVSGRRAAAAPSEPALRGGARRAGAVRRALAVDARRRAEAAGPRHRRVRGRLCDRADRSANSSASPIRSSDFSGAD